jgi:hypothetical protein
MSGSAWFNSFLNSEKADRPGGGGGGKSFMQFGRTRVPNILYPRGGQQRFGLPKAVIRGRFVLNTKFANAMLSKAIFYYSNEKNEDGKFDRPTKLELDQSTETKSLRDAMFFSRFEQDLNPYDVQKSLIENKGGKVAFHEMMISPGSNSIDLVDYTRHQMRALEEQLGHSLIWYGNVHRDTDHFHANVLIAGRIPDGLQIAERAIERLNNVPERILIPEEKRTNDPLRKEEPVRDEPAPLDNPDGLKGMRASKQYDEMARGMLDDGADKLADKLIDESKSLSTDRLAENLLAENKEKSIAQSNIDRSIRRADRALEDKSTQDRFNSKGDVYITRDCYQAMREAGNSYTRAHLDPNRELERALERFDLDRTNDKERTLDEPFVQAADKTQGNSDSLPDLFGVNTNTDETQPDQTGESADVTGSMTVFEPADKDDFKAGDDGTRDQREDEQNRDFPSSRG